MLKCFFSCWFIRSGIIGNSWEVFSNLAFVILNPQPTWPFQYVRDWCGGDREFSKLVALKLSALSPCTPLLMLKYIQNISKYVKTPSHDKCWSRNMYTWDFYFPILYRFYKNANTHKTYQEFPLAVLGKPYFYTSSQPSSATVVRKQFSRMQSRWQHRAPFFEFKICTGILNRSSRPEVIGW